jgi:hypothetical protein
MNTIADINQQMNGITDPDERQRRRINSFFDSMFAGAG